MAYGLQFYFELKSFHGKTSRLEILRKDFVGTSKRIEKGIGDPINIKWEGTNNDNPYYPIWGSSLTFDFFEQSGIGLEQIATDFERDVRIDFYINGSLFWKGWVMPDLCSDKANRVNAHVSIFATDGLAALSKIPLLSSSTDKVVLAETIGTSISDWNWTKTGLISKSVDYNYNATIRTLLQILKVCLDKAELGIGLQVINDLYPTDLATKDDRQFEFISVDVLCYQKDGESKTCEDVLKSILSTFGCVLFQRDGFWFIERINYLEGLRVQTEVYDKDFKFLLTKTDNVRTYLRPSDESTKNEWWFKEDGFIRRLRPPYQFQTIEYEYAENLDICPDSLLWRSEIDIDVTGWKAKGLTATKVYNTLNGEAIITIIDPDLNIPINQWQPNNLVPFVPLLAQGIVDLTSNLFFVKRYGVSQNTGFYSPPIDVRKNQEIKVQFDFKAISTFLFIKIEGVKEGGRGGNTPFVLYWNHKNNLWQYGVQPNEDVILQVDGIRVPFIGNNGGQADFVNDWKSEEVTLPPILASGKMTVIIKGGSQKYIDERGNVSLRQSANYRNFKVDSGIVKEVHSFDIPKTVSFQAENLTVLNGDALLELTDRTTLLIEKEIQFSQRPIVTKKVFKGTSKWSDSSQQESDTVLGFTARSILNQYSTRHNIIEGTNRTKQNLKIGSLLSFDSYKKFAYQRLLICPPMNYNVRQDTYDLNLFQLSCDLAKGRLSEYWLNGNGLPIYKNIFDYTGVECMPTFEAYGACSELTFEAYGICQ